MAKVFISYSHKDEEWKVKLTGHLKVLEMEGYCTLWDDRKIEEGDEWFPGIKKAVNKMFGGPQFVFPDTSWIIKVNRFIGEK